MEHRSGNKCKKKTKKKSQNERRKKKTQTRRESTSMQMKLCVCLCVCVGRGAWGKWPFHYEHKCDPYEYIFGWCCLFDCLCLVKWIQWRPYDHDDAHSRQHTHQIYVPCLRTMMIWRRPFRVFIALNNIPLYAIWFDSFSSAALSVQVAPKKVLWLDKVAVQKVR